MVFPMADCDHAGNLRYVRRNLPNGSVHICVQCSRCREVVRLPEHNYRPLIKIYEVPAGATIHEYIHPDSEGIA